MSLVFQNDAGSDDSASQRVTVVALAVFETAAQIGVLHELAHTAPRWRFLLLGMQRPNLRGWDNLLAHPNVTFRSISNAAESEEFLAIANLGLRLPSDTETAERFNQSASQLFELLHLPLLDVSNPNVWTGTNAQALVAEGEALLARDSGREGTGQLTDSERQAAEPLLRGLAQLADRAVVPERNNRALQILILYSDRDAHIGTVADHLGAFFRYSLHHVYYFPGTVAAWRGTLQEPGPPCIDLSLFDVIVVHYSVRLCFAGYLDERLALQIAQFSGTKVLFIQDEYDHVEHTRLNLDRLGFDLVFTCVPEQYREQVYPSTRYPHTRFVQTLTGYVPEAPGLDAFSLPMREREIRIGYRGRALNPVYGNLAREKLQIGMGVRKLAEARGIPIDIEWDDKHRLYGTEWYRFTGSVRAVLGTESGANVFDFDGKLKERLNSYVAQNPGATYEEIHAAILAPLDGAIRMNQISPRIFEAIRLRTALVLFEGEYSGVVKPDVHFIPLAKDFSNIDEVFEKLENIPELVAMTDRAFDDVIASGRYSYRAFIEGFDAELRKAHPDPPRYRFFCVPTVARSELGDIRPILIGGPGGFALTNEPLQGDLQREAMVRMTILEQEPIRFRDALRRVLLILARASWRLLPEPVRFRLFGAVQCGFQRVRSAARSRPGTQKAFRAVWAVMPLRLRLWLTHLVGR